MRVEKISAESTLSLRNEVLRPGRPRSDSVFSGDDKPDAGHFGVFDDAGRIVAVGTVYPEASDSSLADALMRGSRAWRLRGMATDPAYRSRGCGSLVLKACLDHARREGGATVWCNARTGASGFYFRHGFVKMSDIYEMPGIGPHYLMKCDLV